MDSRVAPCEGVKCGHHAHCKPDGPEAYCECEPGWSFNPTNITAGCMGKLFALLWMLFSPCLNIKTLVARKRLNTFLA